MHFMVGPGRGPTKKAKALQRLSLFVCHITLLGFDLMISLPKFVNNDYESYLELMDALSPTKLS